MLPIDKFSTTKQKTESGTTFIRGGFRYDQYRVLTKEQVENEDEIARIEDKMKKHFWEMAYGDLLAPLDELTFLARYAANGCPSAYPEAARIEELTRKIYELLDWRKQLAAKQESNSRLTQDCKSVE